MGAVASRRHAHPVAAPPPGVLAAIALTVFCATISGASVDWIHGALLALWFETAVVVYWLLRQPAREWPTIALVCWLANVAAAIAIGRGFPRSVLLPTVNLIQALAVAAPLRSFGLDRDFARPRTLAVFYALVLGPTSMACAVIGGLVLNQLTGTPFLQAWTEWYLTTALGQAVLLPPLMVVHRHSLAAIFKWKLLPGTLLLLGVVALAIAVNLLFRGYPVEFLFFPAVVLITFQRGFAGGALGFALVVVYMAGGLHDVHGTLRAFDAPLHLVLVQLYTAAIGFTVVIVGAGLEQRRKLEASLAQAREDAFDARDAAEAASRAKTMFLANMSHELRTPLNAVIGFSSLIHREIHGPLGSGDYRDYAKNIQDAGQHLLDVIGDILDMSKIEAGKYEIVREEIAPNMLVGDCVDIMRDRAAERQVGLVLELAGPERMIADRRAMKQIVLNLLSNAIKFTPAGGRVSVNTKTMHGSLVLAVTDTGIGIPADDLERVGQPFVQLGRATPEVTSEAGTGLGLALVRALAEKHGGTFVIESEDGRGTCARIEIPIPACAASPARVKTAA